MEDRYTRGLAAAIVRNQQALNTARTPDARRYHQGVIDGLKMALAAALAINTNRDPWEPADTDVYERVNIHVRLAEARTG